MGEFIENQHLAKKGGPKTIPYIMASIVFEKIATIGLMANIIIYLTKDYHMSSASGTSALLICSAAMNFMPALGAVLSDSFFGRFKVVLFGCLATVLGMTMLWLTAVLPRAKPPPCHEGVKNCEPPTSLQLLLLFASFAVMAIGAGGIRPCTVAFGADQINYNNKIINKERALQSFFNWYYVLVSSSILVAVTVIVYLQENYGWKLGVGVPTMLMAISSIVLLCGSSYYAKVKGDRSALTGFVQVFVVSFKNRSLSLSPEKSFHFKKGSRFVAPTNRLRFLNRACIIRDPQKDVKQDGSATNPWNLCSADQVEDAKSVLRMIPICSAATIADLMVTQGPIMTLQASSMNRHIVSGSKFQIPPGSYTLFGISTVIIWVSLYDRVLCHRLAKFTGRPQGLTHKQRIGTGIMSEILAFTVAANIERIRRQKANKGFLMSAMWLVPQHCLIGLAEAFCTVTQIQFYYTELPKGMASLGMALFEMGIGVANLFGSLIVRLVHEITGRRGVSWLTSNLNKGHYDYYYWLLAMICSVNFLYFLFCSWVYGEEGLNKDGSSTTTSTGSGGVDEQEMENIAEKEVDSSV